MSNNIVMFTHNYKTSLNIYRESLAEHLNIPTIVITPETNKLKNVIENKNILIIRNNDLEIKHITKNYLKNCKTKIYNSKSNRKFAYLKNDMADILKKNEGIYKTSFIEKEEAINLINDSNPIIIKTISHSGGDGIFYTASKEELSLIKQHYSNELLYEKYIPYEEEKRIIVFNDTSILLKKQLSEIKSFSGKFIRNSHSGFLYEIDKINDQIVEISKYLKSIFEISFFTIDIGICKNEIYVIEINSSLMLDRFADNKSRDFVKKYFASSVGEIFERKFIEGDTNG